MKDGVISLENSSNKYFGTRGKQFPPSVYSTSRPGSGSGGGRNRKLAKEEFRGNPGRGRHPHCVGQPITDFSNREFCESSRGVGCAWPAERKCDGGESLAACRGIGGGCPGTERSAS